MKAVSISLSFKEVPVSIEVEPGRVVECSLREMSGKERDSYMTAMSERMEVVDGKVVGFRSFAGFQSRLVSLCLHKKDGKLFTEEEIQGFPARAQSVLFEAAQELNGLSATAQADAKND